MDAKAIEMSLWHHINGSGVCAVLCAAVDASM